MERVNKTLSDFWQWLTNRSLEVEHLGMGAVISISTWHISQHMHTVEGNRWIAIVMGVFLGGLNALFAMRFFEERGDTRYPAGVGVVFSAVVSIGMQYGFYNENSNLTPYMLWGINFNALMFGGWAPVFEILLGWLYGVRLFSRMEKSGADGVIKAHYEKLLADLRTKFDAQLMVNQQDRDTAARAQSDLSTALRNAEASNAEKDGLIVAYKTEIEQIKGKLGEVREQNAALDATLKVIKPVQTPAAQPDQLTGKLTTEDRRAKLLELTQVDPHITVVSLSKQLGAARNTIKSDLDALQSAGLIHRNGKIEVKG